jgi:hypothetical protein
LSASFLLLGYSARGHQSVLLCATAAASHSPIAPAEYHRLVFYGNENHRRYEVLLISAGMNAFILVN